MRRRLEYSVVDVFADRPLEGNPLAVFHDGRGLSTEQMQALARETNLSETTFVLPSDDRERERADGVRVRIFTTQEELPFAGHPTLGTASWLHLNYPPLQGEQDLRLKLNVGPIPVRIDASASDDAVAGEERGIFATMQQNDAVFGETHDRAEVARVLGLEPSDLLDDAPPQTVSTGNPFCIVAMKPDALERLAIPQREAGVWLAAKKTRWFYCIAPETGRGSTIWQARMQFYSGEDPATGSAAGCAIAWLVQHDWVGSGAEVTLLQGAQIGRPSRLIARAVKQRTGVDSISVSGRTIPVATGAFFLSV